MQRRSRPDRILKPGGNRSRRSPARARRRPPAPPRARPPRAPGRARASSALRRLRRSGPQAAGDLAPELARLDRPAVVLADRAVAEAAEPARALRDPDLDPVAR